MDQETRKLVINELGNLTQEAEELKTSFNHLVEHHQIWKKKTPEEQAINDACNTAFKLVRQMTESNDALKKLGGEYVKDSALSWYAFHLEIEDKEDDSTPEVESVTYQGNDRWQVIMNTVTEGRLKVIIDSDGASWQQIYTYDPC